MISEDFYSRCAAYHAELEAVKLKYSECKAGLDEASSELDK